MTLLMRSNSPVIATFNFIAGFASLGVISLHRVSVCLSPYSTLIFYQHFHAAQIYLATLRRHYTGMILLPATSTFHYRGKRCRRADFADLGPMPTG